MAAGEDFALPFGEALGRGEPGHALLPLLGELGQALDHPFEERGGGGTGQPLEGIDAEAGQAADQIVFAQPGGAFKRSQERLVDLQDGVSSASSPSPFSNSRPCRCSMVQATPGKPE